MDTAIQDKEEEKRRFVVLIVDDDEESRLLMKEILEQDDRYTVLQAPDGMAALETLNQQPADLVISDVRMPRMGGIELLKTIRSLRPGLPFIITTAFGGAIGSKTLALGADDCIYLPFHVDEFRFRVERTLKFNQLLRERDSLERRNLELWGRAITDRLTGLYNRQYFEEIFETEFKRSKRYRTHLGCVMFDIDHFKLVNDDYGHIVGDIVLKEIGGLVLETLRRVDIAARYGGEEFVILLPETTREGTRLVAERLRKTVAQFKFCEDSKLQTDPMRKVTISLGAAYYPDSRYIDSNAFLKAVDDQLYNAKRNGRNRLEIDWEKT